MSVSRICSELIAIRTENPPGRTTELIEYLRDFFDRLGIRSVAVSSPSGEDNIVTTGCGAKLLMCGHVDVVPAGSGWDKPPFSGAEHGGFVWGRGATDMKGGCAAMMDACQTLVDTGSEAPACFAFVCDEETGGEKGISTLLDKKLISPCDCLIAEPCPVRNPSIGQKGLCRLEIEFHGEPAHGSLYPSVGRSAIMDAMDLLAYVRTLHEKEYPVDGELLEIIGQSARVLAGEFAIPGIQEILRKVAYNPGVISGGEKSNVVAQQCLLELEMRIPWGCSIPELVGDIRRHVPRGALCEREIHEPTLTDPASQIVQVTCGEVQKIYGGEVFPIVQWAASDARHLRKAGFNVIEYGPGEIPSLHAVNERVRVESLEKASIIYQGIMKNYG